MLSAKFVIARKYAFIKLSEHRNYFLFELLYLCGKFSVVRKNMKKRLFSLLFLLAYICFQTAVLAQQDAKSKVVSSDVDHVIEIYVVGNKITTENAPVGKKIEVFSVVGLKVAEYEIKTPAGEYFLSVPKGYYILRINDTVRKVAIRT